MHGAIERLRWSFSRYGMRGLLGRGLRRLSGSARKMHLANAPHPFDAAHGLDTSGLLYPREILSGHPNDRYSTAYFGIAPSRLSNALELWRLSEALDDFRQFIFVDIGCGKGRAVLLASELGFRKVTGVELSPELARVARANAGLWAQAGRAKSPIEIVVADATAWTPPPGPCLCFLYNPFGAAVMRPFLAGLVSKVGGREHPIHLLYVHPEEQAVFTESSEITLLWSELVPLSAEDRRDEISGDTDRVNLYRIGPA